MNLVVTGPPTVSDQELLDAVRASGLPQATMVRGGDVAGRYAQLTRAYFRPASKMADTLDSAALVALLDEDDPHNVDRIIREAAELGRWRHVHLVGRWGALPRDGALWPTEALHMRDERVGYLLDEYSSKGPRGWERHLSAAAKAHIGRTATANVRGAWRELMQGALEDSRRGGTNGPRTSNSRNGQDSAVA